MGPRRARMQDRVAVGAGVPPCRPPPVPGEGTAAQSCRSLPAPGCEQRLPAAPRCGGGAGRGPNGAQKDLQIATRNTNPLSQASLGKVPERYPELLPVLKDPGDGNDGAGRLLLLAGLGCPSRGALLDWRGTTNWHQPGASPEGGLRPTQGPRGPASQQLRAGAAEAFPGGCLWERPAGMLQP